MLYSELIFSSVLVSTHQSFLFQGNSILSIVTSLTLFPLSLSHFPLFLLLTFVLTSIFSLSLSLISPSLILLIHFHSSFSSSLPFLSLSNLVSSSFLATLPPLNHLIKSSIPSSSRLLPYLSLLYSNLPFLLFSSPFSFLPPPPLSPSTPFSHFHPSISTTPPSKLFLVHSIFILISSSISLCGQLSSCSNSSDSSIFCLSRLYPLSSIHSSLFILISSSRILIQSSYTSPSLKKILSLSSLSHLYPFLSLLNTLMIFFLFSIISFPFPFLHPFLFLSLISSHPFALLLSISSGLTHSLIWEGTILHLTRLFTSSPSSKSISTSSTIFSHSWAHDVSM